MSEVIEKYRYFGGNARSVMMMKTVFVHFAHS